VQRLTRKDFGLIMLSCAIEHFGKHAARGMVRGIALNRSFKEARRIFEASKREAALGREQ
jgi:hypothetical protein